VPQRAPTPLKTLKRLALQTAKGAGVFDFVADSSWRRQRLLILAFHSVSLDEEHGWRRLLYHTPDEFERRLQLIRRWRLNVLSLDEAIERLDRGTLPSRSAVLTFDDGQADFHQIVWPALERAGYPATVYVTTYYGEKRVPILPLMSSYVLWKARRIGRLDADPSIGVPAADLTDDTAREQAAEAFVGRARRDGLDAAASNARLAALAGRLDVDYDALTRRRVLQIMTPEEMRDIAARGADVQLHTHRHRTPVNRLEFLREIRDNRASIEAATGRPAVHFCYPSGVCHPEFLAWLEGAGVRSATTCIGSLAERSDLPLMLPRLVDTAALNDIEIEGWLSGFSQCLLQRRIRDALLPMRVAPAAAK
jgi:peptidoglycan/xylan/chitin deacetylase (PgdA/CDA1 family)